MTCFVLSVLCSSCVLQYKKYGNAIDVWILLQTVIQAKLWILVLLWVAVESNVLNIGYILQELDI